VRIGTESPTEEVTIERTVGKEVVGPAQGSGYRVILYNDDWHGQDEVVLQIQKATGCDLEKAVLIMLEAHYKGRAVCYHGGRAECQRVANVLRQIRLQCEIDCD